MAQPGGQFFAHHAEAIITISEVSMIDKIKAMVISQQPLFREGIWHTLSATNDMEVATAEITDALLAEIVDAQPHIALVDVDSSPEDSFKLVRRMKQCLPDVGLIILSSNQNNNQFFQALKVQAYACLNKEVTADKLIDAVRNVVNGTQSIDANFTTRQTVAMQALHKFQEFSWKTEDEDINSPLTTRETEILNYVAQGCLNKQIATELGISEQTIKNHVTSILRKLNAGARTEAVVVAIRQGLITIT
ncbi:MAG: response regulator transcription factor [Dehalococcoidales bacterium]|nr:response regulator transcription factor [Dehalococcoidales bacterium]